METPIKSINYNMTVDYCKDWTAISAIREMVQNALDSNKGCKFQITETSIIVLTKNESLPMSAFALGQSVKKGESIGGYGEGFKIGMLVLTRLGLNPTITSDGYVATGKFILDELTGLETFHIVITPTNSFPGMIAFSCDIGNINIKELKNKVTHFSFTPLPKLSKTIHVLKESEYQGQIYVNGLFVCKDEGLTHGYNFSPSKIELNRDRNMAEGVQWQLGQFYARSNVSAKTIFDLIEADAKDIGDFSYFLTDKNKKAELTRLFFNKYGDGATISKPGTTYIGGASGIACGYASSRTYSKCGIRETKKITDMQSPIEVLKKFGEDNKKHLRRDVKVSLGKIINKSKAWRKA